MKIITKKLCCVILVKLLRFATLYMLLIDFLYGLPSYLLTQSMHDTGRVHDPIDLIVSDIANRGSRT